MGTNPAAADTMPGKAGLWALLVCSLFPMVGLFALGPALPRVAAAFGTDPHAIMLAQLMGGASGFSFALSSPLIGALIHRWGYRQIYIGSIVGFALIGSLPALMDNLVLILATRAVLGIAVAGAMTAGMTGLSTLPAALRPRMFGRNAVISSLGAIVAFPLVGAIATFGWRWPFLIHLVFLVVLPAALTLPRTTGAAHAGQRAQAGGIGVSVAILALAAFLGLTMYVGPMFSPFYLHTIGVTDPRLAALPLSGMSLASLLMTSNYRRLHARFGTAGLFGGLLLAVGTGLVLAGLAPTLPVFAAAMILVSCGMSLFTPNLTAYIAATSPSPARGIGWAMSAMFVVQVLFPFLAGGVSRAVGPAAVFLVLGAIALAIATGIAWALLRKGKAPQAIAAG